jgi:hypothetical protein
VLRFRQGKELRLQQRAAERALRHVAHMKGKKCTQDLG